MPKIHTEWYQARSGNWYNKNVCKGNAAHIKAICGECGEEFFCRKHKAKSKKGGNGVPYCSRRCSSRATAREQDTEHLKKYEYKPGQRPHNFKGKTLHSAGYINVVSGKGRKLEHRKVMEAHLNRKLSCNEVVHHVNGDRTDNRIGNLMVMSPGEHTKWYWKNGDFNNR